MATIGSLVVDLRTNTAKFAQGMNEANRKLDGFRNTISKATRVLGVFGAALGTAQLTSFARSSLAAADSIGKVADKVGVSVEALQELRFAAEQSGVANNTLDMALQRLSRRLGEADRGGGELLGTLRQYNIETRDANGRIRTTEEVLGDLADTIKGAASQQEALRIAFKAFDSEGAALVNLLRDGSDGMERLRRQARELGIVMDDKVVREAERVNDQFNIIAKTIRVNLQKAVIGLTAAFTGLFNKTEEARILERMDDLGTRMRNIQEQMFRGNVRDDVAKRMRQHLIDYNTELGILQDRLDALRKQEEKPIIPDQSVESIKDAANSLSDLEQQAKRVFESTRTPLERLNVETARLNDLLDAGKITWDTYARAVMAAQDEFESMAGIGVEIEQVTAKVKEQKKEIEEVSRGVRDLDYSFQSAFEDAIINGDKLRDVIQGLARDVARIFLRENVTSHVAGGLSSMLGGLFGGARASGGPVAAGKSYLVGERGPELFTPKSSGTIIPNGAGGSVSIAYNIDARGADAGAVARIERVLKEDARTRKDQIRAEVNSALSRGALAL